MDDDETVVRNLFIEAATECGADVHAIVLYVEKRLAEMAEDRREGALGVGRRTLAYRAPAQRPERPH